MNSQIPKNCGIGLETMEDDELAEYVQEEDLEESVQSFLKELNILKVLPSSRRQLPSSTEKHDEVPPTPKRNDQNVEEHSTADDGFQVREIEGDITEVKERMGEATLYFDAQLEAEQKTSHRGRGDIFTSNPGEREKSQSPHTDPDFIESPASSSSQSSLPSYTLGQGMISRKIADSMMSGRDGNENSDEAIIEMAGEHTGEIESGEEGDAAAKEDKAKKAGYKSSDANGSDDESEDEGDPNEVEIDVETNKIKIDQVKLAAVVTLVLLALMWKLEPQP